MDYNLLGLIICIHLSFIYTTNAGMRLFCLLVQSSCKLLVVSVAEALTEGRRNSIVNAPRLEMDCCSSAAIDHNFRYIGFACTPPESAN